MSHNSPLKPSGHSQPKPIYLLVIACCLRFTHVPPFWHICAGALSQTNGDALKKKLYELFREHQKE